MVVPHRFAVGRSTQRPRFAIFVLFSLLILEYGGHVIYSTGQRGDGIHGMEAYLGSVQNLHVTLRKQEEVHERKAA